MVWVSGPGPLLRLQKLQVSHFPAGMVRVQLLRPELPAVSLPANRARLDVRSRRVAVPAQETTYWCTVHRLPATFVRKHHIVQVGPHTAPRLMSAEARIVHARSPRPTSPATRPMSTATRLMSAATRLMSIATRLVFAARPMSCATRLMAATTRFMSAAAPHFVRSVSKPAKE